MKIKMSEAKNKKRYIRQINKNPPNFILQGV